MPAPQRPKREKPGRPLVRGAVASLSARAQEGRAVVPVFDLVVAGKRRVGDEGAVDVVVGVVLNVAAVRGPAGPVAVEEIPGGYGADDGHDGEEPPGDDDVAPADAPGKRNTCKGRAKATADGREGGGEAVEGAEDAEGGARVGEEDGHAGEADDDGEGLKDHDAQKGGGARGGILDEDRVGGYDVDEGEDDGLGSVSELYHIQGGKRREAGLLHALKSRWVPKYVQRGGNKRNWMSPQVTP